MAQRDGEHQLHLHAPRKVLDLLLAVLSSPETEIVQVPPIPIPVPCRVERGDDALDLRDLPLFVQVAGVEHDAQPFLDGLLVNDVVEAEHLDAAVVPSDHVEDQLDQRGFSRPVGADHGDHLALGDVEGDVVHHGFPVVLFRKIFNDHRSGPPVGQKQVEEIKTSAHGDENADGNGVAKDPFHQKLPAHQHDHAEQGGAQNQLAVAVGL